MCELSTKQFAFLLSLVLLSLFGVAAAGGRAGGWDRRQDGSSSGATCAPLGFPTAVCEWREADCPAGPLPMARLRPPAIR
jgi:hypothetical protein